MAQRYWNKCRVAPSFYIFMAFLLLVLPLRWLLAMVCAAAFHELCHLAALRFCGVQIHSMEIAVGGAKIITTPVSHLQEGICAAAGPVCSLLLLFFAKWLPVVCVCCMIQSIYNLLPIYPLDGGRILRCLLAAVLSEPRAKIIEKVIRTFILLVICVIGVYGSFFLKLGMIPFCLSFIICFQTKRIKSP